MTTFCKIRLYESVGGRYIDISDMIQGPVLKYVENHGVTGTVKVVNDLSSASRNLLSPSCSRWSSGTGAVKTGMFLQIYKESISAANQLGVFIITELSPDDGVISLTFGDSVQLLRATGADYYRNHYSGVHQHNDEDAYGGWDASANKLYLTKPAGVTLRAENGDVKWAVGAVETRDQEVSKITRFGEEGHIYFAFTCPLDRIFSITFYRKSALKCRVRIILDSPNGPVIASKTYAESTYSSLEEERTIDVTSYLSTKNRTILFYIDQATSFIEGVRTAADSDSTYFFFNRWDGGNDIATGTEESTNIKGVIRGAIYKYATSGEVDPFDSSKYFITGIETVSTIDSSLGTPAFSGRARITYLTTDGGVPMSDIFDSICRAASFDCTKVSSARNVGVFRCGGDQYHNYLLALADMDEPSGSYSGRQHCFSADRTAWGRIHLGYRHIAADASAATLYYAGDGSPGSGAIPMMRFAPMMTMRYRPCLAVTKGTKDDGTPIILAMRDPAVAVGSATTTVDGSITTIEDAALASYSAIITNRSKDWEGEVTLSGCYLDFMKESGTYIGGVPVRIHDSRYGMAGYAARIKQVRIDFGQQTTALTLNNFSEMYANAIIDSTKMAYNAGSMAVEASSSDLFTRQYVSLVTTAKVGSGAQTISIFGSGSSAIASAPADILRVPELGVCVLSAYFPRGIGTVTAKYGIQKVRVGSTDIAIPIDRRPDKYSNQSLIVNVQMNL